MVRKPRHILITGASSGVGAALARLYAPPGSFLALTGRDAARLEAVAADCRALGAEVVTATIDVTDRDRLKSWIERIDDAYPIDLVIANAGTMGPSSDEAATKRIFDTNVGGVFNTVMPLLPRFEARRYGQIAIMASLAGFRGMPGAPAYAASKAAVRLWGESLRPQMKPRGIHVSVVSPGFIDSPMTARNTFSMPWLVSAEEAALAIARGLAQDKGRIAFPWQMYALVWTAAALPPKLGDQLIFWRRFARKKPPAAA
jgi:short-subunit dehydrogenase